jgi:RNA polymerase sigma factor (sigma-70 family)
MFGFRRRDDATQRSEFEALTLEHMDALYGAALRLTRSPKDAEDLVQDTYLKAFRFFDSFEKGTNIKAWLFKIQTNTFINKYRRKVKEREVAETPAEDIVLDRFVSARSGPGPPGPRDRLLRQAPLGRGGRGPGSGPGRLPDGRHPRGHSGLLVQGDRRDRRVPGGHGHEPPLPRPPDPPEAPLRLRHPGRASSAPTPTREGDARRSGRPTASGGRRPPEAPAARPSALPAPPGGAHLRLNPQNGPQ